MKKGDKILTRYGSIETVLKVDDFRIIAYESFMRQTWYHPSKIFKFKSKSA